MESLKYHDLVKSIVEKELRDEANVNKIKECETFIKTQEDYIKQQQIFKRKLQDEIDIKMAESSKTQIKKEILLQQKLIWTDLLMNTQTNLKEEEEKLEALQQSICLNRLAFCDSTKEFIEKLDLLEATHGFYKDQYSSIITDKILTKEETDEYNNLLETKNRLEKELKDLKHEEDRTEEAKRLKAQLQAEPSCGENFLRLQKSLKDMKDKLSLVDEQIRTVKCDIAQKDLLLLNKNNMRN